MSDLIQSVTLVTYLVAFRELKKVLDDAIINSHKLAFLCRSFLRLTLTRGYIGRCYKKQQQISCATLMSFFFGLYEHLFNVHADEI